VTGKLPYYGGKKLWKAIKDKTQNGHFCTVCEVGPVTKNATFSPFDKDNPYSILLLNRLPFITHTTDIFIIFVLNCFP
jgi:hypothetical protein